MFRELARPALIRARARWDFRSRFTDILTRRRRVREF